MGILALFAIICVIGVIVMLIRAYVPMEPPFKTAILIVGLVFIVLLIVSALGIPDMPIPRLH